MRAVKIDPVSRTVTEINLKKNPNRTLEELYEIIGCGLVELVELDRGIIMVVDEEGKCKAVQGAFTFIGWGTVIAGTAIILGGDSIRSFSFAMILGVVFGTLSSIFIAAPIAYKVVTRKK